MPEAIEVGLYLCIFDIRLDACITHRGRFLCADTAKQHCMCCERKVATNTTTLMLRTAIARHTQFSIGVVVVVSNLPCAASEQRHVYIRWSHDICSTEPFNAEMDVFQDISEQLGCGACVHDAELNTKQGISTNRGERLRATIRNHE